MHKEKRIHVGIWSELGAGARWANEGVSRVIGFVVEGAAVSKRYLFHIVVQPGLAETVREDLRTLKAREGHDWLVSEPDPDTCLELLKDPAISNLPDPERQMAAAALYCNKNINVDGWFVSFPFFTGAIHLDKPKATLMPDSLGHDFPLGWGAADWAKKGSNEQWRKKSARVLESSDTVITFSKHVARRHVDPLFGTPPEKIRVVPLAPPDLKDLLPFVKKRRRTEASHKRAANILRHYMAEASVDYLEDFPFEDVPFVFTATQDRISKNLGRVCEAVRRLVQEDRKNYKFLTTAAVLFDADWTLFPHIVAAHQFNRDAFSIRDVPREIHAALFHCATVTVHPTFFEGIIGSLPFYESLSVGTPCLLAQGPHIEELLESEPGLAPFVFDPYDVDQLAKLIADAETMREAWVDIQMPIFERLIQYGWHDVANAYAESAITRMALAA